MTLTNKDKMMLVILAVVIFVAVFYMYGIVPANDELDAIEKEVVAKKEEVDALNTRLAAINMNAIDKKYDALLDFYYSNNNLVLDEPDADPEKIIFDVNRKMIALFQDSQFTNYSTAGWKIIDSYMTTEYDGTATSYAVKYVDCTTSYKTADIDNIYGFLDTVEANKSMYLTSMTVTYQSETVEIPDPENPEGTITQEVPYYAGTLNLRYNMQVKIDTSSLPKLLADVDGISLSGKTVSFNAVVNDINGEAITGKVSYELYTVVFGEDGKGYFTPIAGATIAPDTNSGVLTITVPDGKLEAGTHNIVVRAVGDKKQGFFKSQLKDSMSYVTLTIA